MPSKNLNKVLDSKTPPPPPPGELSWGGVLFFDFFGQFFFERPQNFFGQTFAYLGRCAKIFRHFVCFRPKNRPNQNEKVQKMAFFGKNGQNLTQKKMFFKCPGFHPTHLK